jgi:hypothetical protein
MKKLIPAMMLLALALSSCAVKTVSRKELLTPTLSTAMDHTELTDMKYYGADAEYDYFTRGYTRYRVLKSENCLPESARFAFNNWQGGKLYRDCLKESVGSSLVSKLQELLNGATTNGTTVQQLPAAGTTTSPQPYQPKTQTGQAIKNWLEQRKATKAAQ